MSFIQGFLNTILIHFGTYTNVLYIEGVLNSRVSGVLLYTEGNFLTDKLSVVKFATVKVLRYAVYN